MVPKCLLLLIDDPVRKGGWKVVSVYLSAAPIKMIMDTMIENGMKVEETLDPIKTWENGFECSWDETEAIIADDRLPSIVYTVTGVGGQFVRQFRAVALPMLGGHDMPFVSFWWEHTNLPEWAR